MSITSIKICRVPYCHILFFPHRNRDDGDDSNNSNNNNNNNNNVRPNCCLMGRVS